MKMMHETRNAKILQRRKIQASDRGEARNVREDDGNTDSRLRREAQVVRKKAQAETGADAAGDTGVPARIPHVCAYSGKLRHCGEQHLPHDQVGGVHADKKRDVFAAWEKGMDCEVVLVDATETPVERPKKQKKHYSGKKKRHTMKTQVVVRKSDGRLSFAAGRVHDFRLFKESFVHFLAKIRLLLDSGYQGMGRIHGNCELPEKRAPSKEDKRKNRELSSARVRNEHVIGLVKRFRILAERYRNRRRRFGLRFNLIAGICNYEMAA